MSKQENPFKGDTAWGDFKGTTLGGMLIGLGQFLFVCLQITIIGLLLYYSTKAMVLLIRKLLTGKPLPDFDEFPRTWYFFGILLWVFFIPYLIHAIILYNR
jgi:predicted lipid-binding transport protein (Tim44 family)